VNHEIVIEGRNRGTLSVADFIQKLYGFVFAGRLHYRKIAIRPSAQKKHSSPFRPFNRCPSLKIVNRLTGFLTFAAVIAASTLGVQGR
jgi:hypothetical protein